MSESEESILVIEFLGATIDSLLLKLGHFSVVTVVKIGLQLVCSMFMFIVQLYLNLNTSINLISISVGCDRVSQQGKTRHVL